MHRLKSGLAVLLDEMANLRDGGHVLTGPGAAAISEPGDVRLIDSETGDALDVTLDEEAVRRYAELHERFPATVAEECRPAGVRYRQAPVSGERESIGTGAAMRTGGCGFCSGRGTRVRLRA